jgi:hypothetical protein
MPAPSRFGVLTRATTTDGIRAGQKAGTQQWEVR